MLDVVKFTWRNPHGYWIPVAWVIISTNPGQYDTRDFETRARDSASTGRPSMTDFRILDRITIPEELRVGTGKSCSYWLSMVKLYDKKSDSYTAQEMLDAMIVQTA